MTLRKLPVVRSLPKGFSIEAVFHRLARLPRCLWLDSATRGPREADEESLGRYSFFTADPVETLDASVGDADPWPKIDDWCRALPSDSDADLPPFQGGIAGLWGYEAATWLESVGVPTACDFPTPAVSLGLYDWVIATDHEQDRSWIISTGLGGSSSEERSQRAVARADEIEQLLNAALSSSRSNGNVRSASDAGDCVPLVRADPAALQFQHPTEIPGLYSNLTSSQFRERVNEIVESICNGDSFQVNLAQRLLTEATGPSEELYVRLRQHNPAPFSAYYDGGGFEVLSSSPEGFLQVRGDRVETRPIKGTVPRTGDEEKDQSLGEQLMASEKERAENVMIVDLLRNDLSRVCRDESVIVRQLCGLERYQYVQHLVSVVEGRLNPGQTVADLLRATFPGGSVTGAPKIEAMKTIASLEPNRRGPYCGSIGYISCGGAADFNILIRTITSSAGYWQIPVGGAITARSNANSEEAETWVKAEGMLRAIAAE